MTCQDLSTKKDIQQLPSRTDYDRLMLEIQYLRNFIPNEIERVIIRENQKNKNEIGKLVNDSANRISREISSQMAGLVAAIGGLGGIIRGGFGGLSAAMAAGFASILLAINSIPRTQNNTINNIFNQFNQFNATMQNNFIQINNILNQVNNALNQFNSAFNQFNSAFNQFNTTLNNILINLNNIPAQLQSVLNQLQALINNILNQLQALIQNNANRINNTQINNFNQINNNIRNFGGGGGTSIPAQIPQDLQEIRTKINEIERNISRNQSQTSQETQRVIITNIDNRLRNQPQTETSLQRIERKVQSSLDCCEEQKRRPRILKILEVTIIKEPNYRKIIFGQDGDPNTYFAGWINFTIQGRPLAPEIPIRRQNQNIIFPDGSDGYNIYESNGAICIGRVFEISL